MLTTAAGTIRPAQVLVIGAGVAGLQAIATARRLGAVVEAYDVRARDARAGRSRSARKFIDTGVAAEGTGGYARELTDEEKAQAAGRARRRASRRPTPSSRRPRVPGPPGAAHHLARRGRAHEAPAPSSSTSPRSRGGNCELTRAGETVEHNGVRIIGPVNLPAQPAAYHASEMYARNLYNFLKPALDRTARSRSTGTTRCSREPCSRTTARSGTSRRASRPGGQPHDRRLHRALHLHARGLHRLRGHRARAGDPAHAADVRLELRARHRARRRDGRARRAPTRRSSRSSASSASCSPPATPSAATSSPSACSRCSRRAASKQRRREPH